MEQGRPCVHKKTAGLAPGGFFAGNALNYFSFISL